MNAQNMARSIVLLAVLFCCFVSSSFADGPKPLTKPEATTLITSMGYEDVTIGAIIPGDGLKVLGIGRKNGKITKIEMSLVYDSEIGWFYYQFDDKLDYDNQRVVPPTMIRMWTLDGYKQVMPKQTDATK